MIVASSGYTQYVCMFITRGKSSWMHRGNSFLCGMSVRISHRHHRRIVPSNPMIRRSASPPNETSKIFVPGRRHEQAAPRCGLHFLAGLKGPDGYSNPPLIAPPEELRVPDPLASLITHQTLVRPTAIDQLTLQA
jgi:hypothetical protein